MAREFLRLTPEATWGTYNSLATPILIDIDESNNYTVRPQPMQFDIRTAGVGNRLLLRQAGKTALQGGLNMLLHGSQGTTIAPLIYSSDNATLGSCTIDHCIVLEDGGGTQVFSRDLGMMVRKAQFTGGEADQKMRLQLDLVGKNRDNTIDEDDFPEPDPEDYVSDPIYVFEMASGGLTLASSRVDFETLNITIDNLLDVRFFVGANAQKIKYCGRNVMWTSRLQYASSVPRADFESVTRVAGGVTFVNGSYSLAFDMQSANYVVNVQDDLSLDKVFLQEVSMQAAIDSDSGTDFTLVADD